METVTTAGLLKKKQQGEKITALTAYDYPTAKLLDEAGIDVALVGDSVGQVVLGYSSTLPVTMEDMIHHTSAVVRGIQRALVVADMPFMSYQINADEAVANAGRLIQEAGAQAVKLEGGRTVFETVKRIVDAGIPVMGHVGYTPQSVHKFGGPRVQGKTEAAARQMLEDAKALEDAGVFSIVLELVPKDLAGQVTESVSVPTIGVGAGPLCDGQVLVTNDILGLYGEFYPKHAKRYADLSQTILAAFRAYIEEVKSGKFPTDEHSF